MSTVLPFGERYQAGTSLVHRLEPRAKLLVTVAFIFAATLTPVGQWPVFAGLALILAAAVALSALSPLLVLRRSALALPFILVAVPTLFTKEGEELFRVPALFWTWTATDTGLETLLSILAKSWLSVCAAVVLTASTSSPDLLRALRRLGVPRIIAATVFFMYRYIFVIGEEALRLMRARESRSARVGSSSGGSLLWRARVTGNMVGTLFLRSYERGERVYDAMRARGFDGELRFLAESALHRIDLLAIGLVLTLLTGLQIYARI
jgi:cobalt/nickel transport system permease protein